MRVNVFIENEAGSDQKNCFNEQTLEFIKTVTVSRSYPYAYGFIPNTISDDEGNVDCFVLTNQKLKMGDKLEVEPIGLVEQLEDSVNDHKILVVPIGESAEITDEVKSKITDFILHVFDHKETKEIKVGNFYGKEEAEKYIKSYIATKQYKVIFFDWHKTLSLCDFWVQLQDPAHDRHHWHKNITNFLFVENERLIQQWMRGEINEDEIVQIVSRKFGYAVEVLRADLAESCRAMTLLSDKIFPLIDMLQSRGVKCVIATDNMDVFKKYVVPALKLDEHFDDVLVSFDQKALKFDVSEDGNSVPFFHEYLQKNGFTYLDALLVDDRLDTSGVYAKLGLDTFQVKNIEGLLGKLKDLTTNRGKME
ncbi:MAG: inorganic diphosphatase [Patescibacteria group bacterium]